MSSELKVRIFSGIVFGLIIILAVLAPLWLTGILFGLMGMLCIWELFSFFENRSSLRVLVSIIYLIIYLFLFFGLFMPDVSTVIGSSKLSTILSLLIPVFLIFWALYIFYSKSFHPSAINILGSFTYIITAFLAASMVRSYDQGQFLSVLLVSFILVWTNDSFAYFIGKKWGSTRLAPRVSPKKTIEGLAGGIFFTILAGSLVAMIRDDRDFGFWLGLSTVVALTSPIGDLLESKIKRLVKIKDSGSIIPGHGGILDRLDGFIFAIPLILIFIIKYN